MVLVSLGVAVALVFCGPQTEAPAFRGEAFIIPFYVTVSHGKKPIADLTVAHFTSEQSIPYRKGRNRAAALPLPIGV